MATRFYLHSTGDAPVAPAYDISWDDTSIAARLPMSTTPSSSAMTTVNFPDDGDDSYKIILFRQFISKPINAQTITTDTIDYAIRGMEYDANNNMFNYIIINVVSNDGSSETGNITKTGDQTELAFSILTNRYHSLSPKAEVEANQGDRIVIELGTTGTPEDSNDHQSSLSFGDDSGTDLPENDTETTAYNPWVEFSQTITFADEEPTETTGITLIKSLNKIKINKVSGKFVKINKS